MNCIIVDDEPIALNILEDWIKEITFINLKGSFRSSVKALQFLNNNSIDLIFLDINIPELSGIQLMKLIDSKQLVIFTTAYPEYALESYELNAVDYLLKPIEFDRFLKAVLRAKEIFELKSQKNIVPSKIPAIEGVVQKENNLFVKSGVKIINLELDKILYVESAGSYVNYITNEKKIMCLQRMDDVTSLLPEDYFVRVHKSYIVSLKHIEKIEGNHIKIGDKSISIGRTFRDNFYKTLKSN